jgi:hypothetical protein
MKHLLCVPLLSIFSVSNDAKATTCSICNMDLSELVLYGSADLIASYLKIS